MINLNKTKFFNVLYSALLIVPVVTQAKPLELWEIQQIESDLGITMSESDKRDLAAIVKPDSINEWRRDADARIEQTRKRNLTITVVDSLGNPVPNAGLKVKLLKKNFNFGGVMNLKRFAGAVTMGITTDTYKEKFLKFFDASGLNNGLKPKLQAGNKAYLPDYFAWCDSNKIQSRGHALIWPAGDHLPSSLRSIVDEIYETATIVGQDTVYNEELKDSLKAEIETQMVEWASLWPVYEWDVYNEPFGNHEIQEILGYDVMMDWFHIARDNAVNPQCGLFINDNRMISAPSASSYIKRTDIYHWYIDTLIKADAPITGIGFQNRIKFEYHDPALLYSRLEDFAIYGLDMAGTEFHIPDQVNFTPTNYRRAEMTEEIMTTYYSHALTTGLNCWSYLSDDPMDGAFLNNDGTVNLNGLVWYYINRIRYGMDRELTTNVNGTVTLRGFKGEYEISLLSDNVEGSRKVRLNGNRNVTFVTSDMKIVGNLNSETQTRGEGPLVSYASRNFKLFLPKHYNTAKLEVFSAFGHLVKEITLREGYSTISLSVLATGVYLYTLTGENSESFNGKLFVD